MSLFPKIYVSVRSGLKTDNTVSECLNPGSFPKAQFSVHRKGQNIKKNLVLISTCEQDVGKSSWFNPETQQTKSAGKVKEQRLSTLILSLWCSWARPLTPAVPVELLSGQQLRLSDLWRLLWPKSRPFITGLVIRFPSQSQVWKCLTQRKHHVHTLNTQW